MAASRALFETNLYIVTDILPRLSVETLVVSGNNQRYRTRHLQHELCKHQRSNTTTVVSFEVSDGKETVSKFLNALEIN